MEEQPSTRDSRASSAEMVTVDQSPLDNGRFLQNTRSNVLFNFKPKYVNTEGVTVEERRLCSRPLSACNTPNLKSHLFTVHRDNNVFDKIKDKKVLTFS